MTDVSFSVMCLLMAIGMLLIALKSVPLSTGTTFVYASWAVLGAHAVGLKIVAPISEEISEPLTWITFALMIAMLAFVAARGLVRIFSKDKPVASGAAN